MTHRIGTLVAGVLLFAVWALALASLLSGNLSASGPVLGIPLSLGFIGLTCWLVRRAGQSTN